MVVVRGRKYTKSISMIIPLIELVLTISGADLYFHRQVPGHPLVGRAAFTISNLTFTSERINRKLFALGINCF